MGFNFNRAGESGGKVTREPMKISGIGPVYNFPAGPSITPTSPQFALNNTQVLQRPQYGFTYDAGTKVTFSISLTSNQWIDMVMFYPYGAYAIQNISIDGQSIQTPNFIGATAPTVLFPIRFLDIYGYGRSFEMALTTAARGVLAPIQPVSIINASGMVVYPQRLYGRYVQNDIPTQ